MAGPTAIDRARRRCRNGLRWSCGLLSLLLLCCAMASPAGAATQKRYAITLVSSLQPIRTEELPDSDVLARHVVYTTEYRKGDRMWYRLRLGFFESVKEVRKVLAEMRPRYGDPWIDTVSEAEYALALKGRITTESLRRAEVVDKSVTGADVTLEQARQALTRGDAAAAIPLLRRVLDEVRPAAARGETTATEQAREALELLGVAQERTGAAAAALASYRDFLRRYPKGEASDRVRQRLTVLETATAAAPKAMKKFEEDEERISWSGSFSQFSNRDVRFLSTGQRQISSSLFNDLDINGRYRGKTLDMRTQFSGSYRYDFKADNTTDDQLRVSSMFVDLREKRHNTGAVLGRQSASTGGVLGRFDGAWLSYRARPRWKYNLVAGYPVELSSTRTIHESDRHFVGANIDMGTFADVWDLNAFAITQTINGIDDREAVGGELRYSDRSQAHLLLLDYDVGYSVLNSFLTVANWFLPTATSINLVLDYRTAPVLTTSNALIGRTEQDIAQMLQTLTEAEVRQLARDRTAVSRTVTLGASHPFSQQYQLNGDVTVTSQDGTPASGGVAAVDATGNQVSYSLTLIGSGVIKAGDIAIAGVRYGETTTATVSSLNLNVRYPLTNAWRAGPSLVVDYRNGKDGIDQVSYKPSLRIDYRWLTNITFDTEISVLYLDDKNSGLGDDTDLFFELGYRIDF